MPGIRLRRGFGGIRITSAEALAGMPPRHDELKSAATVRRMVERESDPLRGSHQRQQLGFLLHQARAMSGDFPLPIILA
jgi:hypothetical protein